MKTVTIRVEAEVPEGAYCGCCEHLIHRRGMVYKDAGHHVCALGFTPVQKPSIRKDQACIDADIEEKKP